MNKEQLQELFEKYYKAETDLLEEAILRRNALGTDEFTDKSDVFAFFEQEAFVPENFENEIFTQIAMKEKSRKQVRIRFIQIVSVAAVLLVFVSVFLLKPKSLSTKELTADEQFMVLEQALAQVSYILQPEENDDLLVIFQDENFEIVMN